MNGDERSDGDLMDGTRARADAAGVLYARHAPAVWRYLSRRVDLDTAQDLLGEVFATVLTARSPLPHPSGSALPWLYGIAGNLVRHHLRRKPTPAQAGRDTTVDWDAIDDRLDAQNLGPQLKTALAALTGDERELLLLVAWEQLSPSEAAAALGINPATARSRLHRARAHAQPALSHIIDVVR